MYYSVGEKKLNATFYQQAHAPLEKFRNISLQLSALCLSVPYRKFLKLKICILLENLLTDQVKKS